VQAFFVTTNHLQQNGLMEMLCTCEDCKVADIQIGGGAHLCKILKNNGHILDIRLGKSVKEIEEYPSVVSLFLLETVKKPRRPSLFDVNCSVCVYIGAKKEECPPNSMSCRLIQSYREHLSLGDVCQVERSGALPHESKLILGISISTETTESALWRIFHADLRRKGEPVQGGRGDGTKCVYLCKFFRGTESATEPVKIFVLNNSPPNRNDGTSYIHVYYVNKIKDQEFNPDTEVYYSEQFLDA
jgi:hypothetical protein